jgi:RimJ/RimL family protein N-acetyltransferase
MVCFSTVEEQTMISLVDPVPTHLLPLAWGWLEPVRQMVCDDYSPKNIASFVEFSIEAVRRGRVMGVRENERLVGVITFEQVNPAMANMHVLFSPHFKGVQKTGVASRMACERLFATTSSEKILGLIPSTNRLAIALAVRSGARIEGVLRSHTLRDGVAVDAVAVGITKEEFGHGTGYRRAGRGSIEQHQVDEHNDAGILGGPVELAVGTGGDVVEPAGIGANGNNLTQRASDGDGLRQPDQQDLGCIGHGDQPVSGKPRVRGKRTDRGSGASDGAGKTSGARGKRERSKRAPVAAK